FSHPVIYQAPEGVELKALDREDPRDYVREDPIDCGREAPGDYNRGEPRDRRWEDTRAILREEPGDVDQEKPGEREWDAPSGCRADPEESAWEEPEELEREMPESVPREEAYDTIPCRPPAWMFEKEETQVPPSVREQPEPPKNIPVRKKKRKRKALILVFAVLAALILLGAVIHGILVHRPDIQPQPQEENESIGVHPDLLSAGRREDVYTFLLVGRDDGGGGNTDTLMVGCYDVKNGTLDVMSIYRDTLVDVPWEIKKINSVYNWKGMEGLQSAVKDLIGYSPDYYFLMELDIVAQLVDAIGGVDYELPFAMHYDDPTQDLHIHFEAGLQHFNGEDAVKVLRWRKNNSGESRSVGDVGRVEIQHSFLKAMMGQTLRISTLTNITTIARIVDKNLTSNLSYGEMMWFGEHFLMMNKEGLRFHTMPGDATGTIWSPTYQNNQSYVFVNDGALLELVNTYMNPYTTAITADMQHVIHGTTVDNLSGGQFAPVE
ncbi:MAG: LCP family protein, partial [Ruminiclostridium sp.]|nr:LCP family protein [Ruminiclostridium sp.]